MQMQITARHFDADPTLREHADARLAKLTKYYDGITDARVVLTEDGAPAQSKSAEVILQVYRQTLSAQSQGATFEEAIDGCVEALRRQLIKYKAKLRSLGKDYQK